jgi:hypothetical protein
MLLETFKPAGCRTNAVHPGSSPIQPLHFACAPTSFGCIVEPMARERKKEPGSTTAAFRNLLQRDDLTMKTVRRRTNFVLLAAIGALALAGWLLAYFA